MILLQSHRHPTSKKELRHFAWLLLALSAIFGIILYARGKRTASEIVVVAGGFLAALSLVNERAGRAVFAAWAAWGMVVSSVVSYVIVAFIYFLILTPLAIVFRITGRDILQLRRRAGVKTYWRPLPKINRSSYDHLF